MYRIRIELPKGRTGGYQNLDLLHDALVNAWIKAGASPEMILGEKSLPWNFAPLGHHHETSNKVHTLVVSAGHPGLVPYLALLKPEHVQKARLHTEEEINFSGAALRPETDPVAINQKILNVIMLSPLAIRHRKGKRLWHTDLSSAPLNEAINARLSRLANRKVSLQIQPDKLYLRANPEHSVLIYQKKFKNGRGSFVIAMSAPISLMGSDDDLRLAWYAGIGEKTRNGFGCIGLAEKGIGR